jgi:hypothetical protein
VKEARDGGFFVETVLGGETQRVDAAKLTIGATVNRAFDGGGHIRACRLPQYAKESFDLAHFWSSRGSSRDRTLGQHSRCVKATPGGRAADDGQTVAQVV